MGSSHTCQEHQFAPGDGQPADFPSHSVREEHGEAAEDEREDDNDGAPTEEDAHRRRTGPSHQAGQQEQQSDQTNGRQYQADDLISCEFHDT
jgi:hypothetical protein